eukprot:COSAG01_NODE_3283_length_6310_cov_8.652391_3_plen_222_part_00
MRYGGLLDDGDDDYDDDHDEAGGTLWPSPAYDAFEIAAAPLPPHGGGDTAHDTHGGGQAKPGLASFHSIPVSGAPLPPRVPPPHPVDSGGAVKMAAGNKRTRADEEAATATVALPVELVGGATLPNLEGDEEELRRSALSWVAENCREGNFRLRKALPPAFAAVLIRDPGFEPGARPPVFDEGAGVWIFKEVLRPDQSERRRGDARRSMARDTSAPRADRW